MQDHCLLCMQCEELEYFSIPLRCKFWRSSFSTDSWIGYIHSAAYVYVVTGENPRLTTVAVR